MPAPDRLKAAYEEASGRRLRDIRWFEAEVRYKQASVTAMLVKNGRKQETPNPRAAQMTELIPQLLDQTMEMLG